MDEHFNWGKGIHRMNSVDTVEILGWIKELGLPKDPWGREKLLRRLGAVHEGDYPVTYAGMCDFSEEFAKQYPPEIITGLVGKCITGAAPYQEEIERGEELSGEEKALLLFVLPM